jgi:hypothetical protein
MYLIVVCPQLSEGRLSKRGGRLMEATLKLRPKPLLGAYAKFREEITGRELE